MKKCSCAATLALGSCLTGDHLASQPAIAGPLVEFGNEGYMQFDVKLQGIADFTDFGSEVDGTKSRSDFYLRRSRLVFAGMINDTWDASSRPESAPT